MAINAGWHRAHPMPKRPTPAVRLRWHEAHAKHCSCRPFTAAMLAQLLRAAAAKKVSRRAV